MPGYLEQCFPVPFGVANTSNDWDTGFSFAHKQKSSSQTAPDLQIAAAFAGPLLDLDAKTLSPMIAQMPVKMPMQNISLTPAPQNKNPFMQQDAAAIDRSALTPDNLGRNLLLQSSVSPSVSNPSHHDSMASPSFSDAVIYDTSQCPDFDWNENSAFKGDPGTQSMGFPQHDCPIPEPGNDGDMAFFLPSPFPPRMLENISSNTTMDCQSYQDPSVEQIATAGPACPSTHLPSPAEKWGARNQAPVHQGSVAYSQPQAQRSPNRVAIALNLPRARNGAVTEIKPTWLDARNGEGLDCLADEVPWPVPPSDLTFLRLADDLTEISPTLATAVPPTPAVHVNGAALQQTRDRPALGRVAEVVQGDGNGRTFFKHPHALSFDTDIYTCTYHRCTRRFETPRKLQEHKREAHRRPIAGPSSGVSLPTSAPSQAGPHKCERVNPSTGRPCHSIFSRPYDLTRHEDTVHNAHKAKLRCHVCMAEQTYTRRDALTRHMRVAHPQVPWAGKRRQKDKKTMAGLDRIGGNILPGHSDQARKVHDSGGT